MATSVFDLERKVEGVKKKKGKEGMASQRLSKEQIIEMVKILAITTGIQPKIVFSKRLKRPACYQRSIPITVPVHGMTEDEVLHEFAHIVQIEASRTKPHGIDFKDKLRRLEESWYGEKQQPFQGGLGRGASTEE